MESGRSKKCIRAVVITLGFVLFPYLYGQAEEQSSKLPEDGWWIRYSYTDKQDADGQVRQVPEFTQKITYFLVGTVMEDGEKCRWVELKIQTTLRGEEDVNFLRFLVPEFDQVTSPVIAAERIQTKDYEKEKLILSREENFVIEDIGSDAKSSLPEIN